MTERLSVIIADSDDARRQMLRGQIEQMADVELLSETRNMEECYDTARLTRPDILIAKLNAPNDSGKTLTWVERIKLEFPQVAVFINSDSNTPETITAAMRAGAQEFFSVPVDNEELHQAVQRVLRLKERRQSSSQSSGRIISVFCKKGGLGVTTLSTNLAIALSEFSRKKVALVGLDLQLGDTTSFLDLSPPYNILDACGDRDLVDGTKLQSCMTPHKSGVLVLAEPEDPVESVEVSSSQIDQILRHMRSTYSWVVVDNAHQFDSKTLGAFERSDDILLLAVSTISAIRATKKSLAVLKSFGYGPNKVKIIVNRTSKKDSIQVEEIENTLDHPVFWSIPNNYPVVVDSINTGVPLVQHKHLSNVAKSIMGLAEILVKREEEDAQFEKDQD